MNDDAMKFMPGKDFEIIEDEEHNMRLYFINNVEFYTGESITLWTSILADRVKIELGHKIFAKYEELVKSAKDQNEALNSLLDWIHQEVQKLEEKEENG